MTAWPRKELASLALNAVAAGIDDDDIVAMLAQRMAAADAYALLNHERPEGPLTRPVQALHDAANRVLDRLEDGG